MGKFFREFGREIKARLLPFLMLLDSRYLPLILVESYQSFTVYLWLWTSSPKTGADFVFSVLGGVGFTAIYVGVIAWAERREYSGWISGTAFTALIFGVSVAITHFWPTQGLLAILHAGFPLTGFLYTLAMHGAPAPRNPFKVVVQWLSGHRQKVHELEHMASTVEQLNAEVEQVREEMQKHQADAEQRRLELEQECALTERLGKERMKHEQYIAQLQQLHEREMIKTEQAIARAEQAENAGDLDRRAIAQALNSAGMTVRQIAGLLNVSTGTISNWTKASNNGVHKEG